MSSSVWSRAFGSAGIDAMQVYDSVLVPRFFTMWGRVLLEEVGLAEGEVVLDVACGPGTVTRLASAVVGPTGRVTGCDLSPAMLTIAQGKSPVPAGAPIDYHEAPAERLPVAAASCDVAVCQQGLQFFPDRPGAVTEMHRALRPGGRVGIAVWTAIEQAPAFAALETSIREVLGAALADRYGGGPWGMPRGDDISALLEAAGFRDVRVIQRTLPLVFDGGPSQAFSTLAASGIAADVSAAPSETQRELAQAVERNMGKLLVDGELRTEASSHLAFGVR